MRIAIVSTHPPSKQSLNEYAYHFVRYLREKPEVSEVILLVDELPNGQPYPPDEPAQGNLSPLRYIPCWRFDAPRNALRIREAVNTVAPDVVLFNLQFATFGGKRVPAALGLTAPWLVKQSGITTAVLLHNIIETVDLEKAGFGENPIMKTVTMTFGTIFTRLLLKADLVALTIPKYVEILEKKYNAQNVFLAPHGSFESLPTPNMNIAKNPMQIMAFGKFGTYKKVEALIEAYDILRKKLDMSLELVIAGTDNPNTKGYLEGVKQQYAHIPNIRFTGYVAEEDVPRIFQEAAVVVFPYNSTTGSSGVLHQAGSYGCAVALPNLGDLAELVQEEGYTGVFFEPENAISLAEAIEKILIDDDLRQQIGLQNYRAAQGVPIDEVVDWYLLHFDVLLTAKDG